MTPGRKPSHDGVRAVAEPERRFAPFRMLEVDGDVLAAPQQGVELRVLGLPADIGRAVHAQHVRAHVASSMLQRPRPMPANFHDPDPVQRAHGLIAPFGVMVARA